MSSKAEDTRAQILNAAETVVQRDGVANLTLAAVAREAGVSKGGLLYHFPNKDALIEGMIALLMDEADDYMAAEREVDPQNAGRWLRAYIRCGTDPQGAQLDRSAGILAAAATNRDLLRPMKHKYQTWQRASEDDGLDPALATIIRLAIDGLWLAEMLGFSPLSEAMREQVLEKIVALTHEDTQ